MKKAWLLDLRSQDRYTNNGDMKQLTDDKDVPQTLEQFVDALPDLQETVCCTVETQPAVGLFDEETLAHVQKSFPYNTYK